MASWPTLLAAALPPVTAAGTVGATVPSAPAPSPPPALTFEPAEVG